MPDTGPAPGAEMRGDDRAEHTLWPRFKNNRAGLALLLADAAYGALIGEASVPNARLHAPGLGCVRPEGPLRADPGAVSAEAARA